MSIEYIENEIYHCQGFIPTSQEVEEIRDFYEQSPKSDLSEIISDYYGW